MEISDESDVRKLEQQLSLTLERRKQLEEEIEADVSIFRTHSKEQTLPIPVEIQINIFSVIISSDMRNMATLLSVCHSWRSIIIGTPLLWSTINLVLPADLTRLPLWTNFCCTCVERSGLSPLFITLDYDKVRETHKVNTYFPPYIQYRTVRRLGMGMCAWMQHRLLPALPNYAQSSVHLYTGPLKALIGKNGCVLARWYSFTFRGNHSLRALSSILHYSISRRRLRGCQRRDDGYSFIGCQFDDLSNQVTRSTHPKSRIVFARSPPPHMPMLRRLGLPIYCSLNSFDPLIVLELEREKLTDRIFLQILRFRSLVYLCLATAFQSRPNTSQQLKEGDVSFPHLVSLEASNGLSTKFWELLDAPVLEVLRVHTSYYNRIPNSIPTLPQLTRIEFSSNHSPHRETINTLLSASPVLQTMTCYNEFLSSILSCLRSNSGRKLSLRQIIGEESRSHSHPLRCEYVPTGEISIYDVASPIQNKDCN